MVNPEIEWAKEIKETLEMTVYCCISTRAPTGCWANPVYFSYDDSVNLYFISQPHSAHMENLRYAPGVAVAIYSTAQSTNEPVRGIQLRGEAAIIKDLEGATAAYDTYFGRVFPKERRNIAGAGPKVGGKGPEDYLGNSAEWQFVKVMPSELWYFDNRYFGEERVKVPKDLTIEGI